MILIISKKERRKNGQYKILFECYNKNNVIKLWQPKRLVYQRSKCSTQNEHQLLTKGYNMNINFILFRVYIEKYTNWSNLKVTNDKYETIIDFGKYRLYVS